MGSILPWRILWHVVWKPKVSLHGYWPATVGQGVGRKVKKTHCLTVRKPKHLPQFEPVICGNYLKTLQKCSAALLSTSGFSLSDPRDAMLMAPRSHGIRVTRSQKQERRAGQMTLLPFSFLGLKLLLKVILNCFFAIRHFYSHPNF